MFCEDKLDYKEWNTEKGKLLLNDDLKSQIYTMILESTGCDC